MTDDIIAKYGDARLPRYTSYPTAPKFSNDIGALDYSGWIKGIGAGTASLYLHIPFCRSMCWYCGCHTTITEKDQPILDYLDILKREIEMVADHSDNALDAREIHFGGGTPTIIEPRDFVGLMSLLRQNYRVHAKANVSVEIDPRTLTMEMAAALGDGGVTRASLGVQSFDPVVQKAINRIQSEETTAATVEALRRNGIGGINFDLIYGLPHQTVASCRETVRAAIAMRPDRFAVFGYAHIPSFKKHQRLVDENALPDAQARHEQAEAIAEALVAAGYGRIGLDHFALPEDELAIAAGNGQLRRNFQGYTTDNCDALLGFGASSIGRVAEGYVQNEVPPGSYARKVSSGELPPAKGYKLTREDRLRAHVIERLMCDFAADVPAIAAAHGFSPDVLLGPNHRLRDMAEDGLISLENGMIRLDGAYRFLVRTVAATFDSYLADSQRTFSKAA
ncbi:MULTISPECIES: oxygen-independent coproporphyrinogen III oxidase [unclassified Rhizobium]|uniref:oxygen-independent coproporphyrinogen III oxidase n=1 Tax=unclassified Rhizobium TaxID=2613769 RepID=UPI0006F6A4B3|nr:MULTISPECIES: oxygen-independent coproporphyrinogen III oxidase [unclassified Rhizobium]KQV41693.1 coproporphyrinogen III oxidase [Rhizobium sp. Root1212]KRD32209.1 coproporphyrinogen III oxidase [Rhizobium sp. Root268]